MAVCSTPNRLLTIQTIAKIETALGCKLINIAAPAAHYRWLC